VEEFTGDSAAEEVGKCSDIFGYGHLVIVQYDNHVSVQMPCVIQAFKGDTAGHRSVPYHGDGFVGGPFQITGGGETESRGYGGG